MNIIRKSHVFAVVFGLASVVFAAQKDNSTLQVTVIENVPTSNDYNWSVSGSSSVSCYGYSCSAYYNPPEGGTAQANGAVLKLLLSDGRIVIAECEMKPDNARNWINAIGSMNGSVASAVYRNCRVPESGSIIGAKFKGNNVKLFMREPSIDGTGKGYSETYWIRGVLEPGATHNPDAAVDPPQDTTSSSQEEQLGIHAYLHQQYNDALPHFLAAAKEGNAEAYSYLGYMYKFGRGVEKDDAASVEWFRKSVAAGNSGDSIYLPK